MNGYVQILTTTASQEDARRIADTLIEARLAACIQITGPISSTYRWQGQVDTAEEWQCCIKTRRELYDAVEQAIRRIHPYQVPEILCIPILAGSPDYLSWIDEQTCGSGSPSVFPPT